VGWPAFLNAAGLAKSGRAGGGRSAPRALRGDGALNGPTLAIFGLNECRRLGGVDHLQPERIPEQGHPRTAHAHGQIAQQDGFGERPGNVEIGAGGRAALP